MSRPKLIQPEHYDELIVRNALEDVDGLSPVVLALGRKALDFNEESESEADSFGKLAVGGKLTPYEVLNGILQDTRRRYSLTERECEFLEAVMAQLDRDRLEMEITLRLTGKYEKKKEDNEYEEVSAPPFYPGQQIPLVDPLIDNYTNNPFVVSTYTSSSTSTTDSFFDKIVKRLGGA
jgi:hypothetical protein